jgi:hypothetical protein
LSETPNTADAEIARLAQRRKEEGSAGFSYFAAVELHPAHAASEDDHLPRISGQDIVQPIVRAAPDIERVEIGREIRRRRYELERV